MVWHCATCAFDNLNDLFLSCGCCGTARSVTALDEEHAQSPLLPSSLLATVPRSPDGTREQTSDSVLPKRPRPAALPSGGGGATVAAGAAHETKKPSTKKPKLEGARSPERVAHALSFKGGAIAWSILHGHKIVENRPYRLPTGGWIALHVGKGKLTAAEVASLRARLPAAAREALPSELQLAAAWGGAIVGAFRVRECRRPANCGTCEWASGPVCNVIDATVTLPAPVRVPAGALSLWAIDGAGREKIAAQLGACGSAPATGDTAPSLGALGAAPAGATAAATPEPTEPFNAAAAVSSLVVLNDLSALPLFEPIIGVIQHRPRRPSTGGGGDGAKADALPSFVQKGLPPRLPPPLSAANDATATDMAPTLPPPAMTQPVVTPARSNSECLPQPPLSQASGPARCQQPPSAAHAFLQAQAQRSQALRVLIMSSATRIVAPQQLAQREPPVVLPPHLKQLQQLQQSWQQQHQQQQPPHPMPP